MALILAFVLMTPVFANDQGTSPLIVFRNGALRTREVVLTQTSNIQAPDIAFEFITQSGDRNAEHYTHNGSVLQYSPPAPEPDVSPKPAKFVIDCNADGGIPANLRQSVNIMALWFNQGQQAIALEIWTMIKTSATAGQITAIRGHATDNRITLP